MSPDDDPHAYALYFYTRAGDHIGWHYDTSYYAGRRYTLLLGVIEESSCRLDYQLHTRKRGGTQFPTRCRFPREGWCFSTAMRCVTVSLRLAKARRACR